MKKKTKGYICSVYFDEFSFYICWEGFMYSLLPNMLCADKRWQLHYDFDPTSSSIYVFHIWM